MAVYLHHLDQNGKEHLACAQRTGPKIVRGKDRLGLRTGNWVLETSNARRTIDSPQVEKARILIETSEIIGPDRLTAQDIAVHEYLLACAREQGIDKPKHRIPMRQLCDYLGVVDAARVWKSLERIQSTLIKYRIVDPGVRKIVALKSLAEVSMTTDLRTGHSVIDYSIPGIVRDAILASRSYTWLDINLFAMFKSKYSGRLYPKLALMAGYHPRFRKPWTPMIEELADFVGFSQRGEDIHVGGFLRAIDRAFADLSAHVHRFEIAVIKPVARRGRGNKTNGRFHINVSDAAKSLMSCAPAVLGPTQVGRIESRRDSTLHEREHPPVMLFAKAQTLTGIDADVLSDRWRLHVAAARTHADRRFGAMRGSMLTSLLDNEGVASAFRQWVTLAVQLEDLEHCASPPVTDETPRFVPGKLKGTWVEEELYYADGFSAEDEEADLHMYGSQELSYGESDAEMPEAFDGGEIDDNEIDF